VYTFIDFQLTPTWRYTSVHEIHHLGQRTW